MASFNPDVVVLQTGADSLRGDRLGLFNLEVIDHLKIVKRVREYNKRMVVLGGGGDCPIAVARCWALEANYLLTGNSSYGGIDGYSIDGYSIDGYSIDDANTNSTHTTNTTNRNKREIKINNKLIDEYYDLKKNSTLIPNLNTKDYTDNIVSYIMEKL